MKSFSSSKYNVLADNLKGSGNIVAEILTTTCNIIWRCEEVSEDWKNGIVLPLPKKGDLTQCTNWRRISLQSMPGEVMATILLNRMRMAVDRTLHSNQAGFRPGRFCCDQIFLLRQIIDKCLAWQFC